MENASKALIMAGSVLIALMILGALLLMFSNLNNYQNTGTQNEREAQVIEFNNQFETYNRSDVRGSDLYSLLNRATDYNERKSTEGIEGKEIAFEPIKITIDFNGKRKELTKDNTNRLFVYDKYTAVDSNKNEFENTINEKIKRIEDTYGKLNLTNLTASLTSIFLENKASAFEKKEAIKKFNENSNEPISDWRDIEEDSDIRKEIYTYYEFIQFKRAHFKCTNTEYNKNTGRIVKMEFEFTGTFN